MAELGGSSAAPASGEVGLRRETRLLAIVIIPFLAAAVAILYGFPTETARLFAWEIKPPMSAMMLGAAYAGGVWFFGRAVLSGRWRAVMVGFPAVCTFASLLGVATVLHWDRFIHESLAFVLWAILYFTTPFLVAGAWLQQRPSASTEAAADPGPRLPFAVRGLFALIAVATIPVAIGLFLVPTQMAASWPWALTALTARVTSAMFALPGIVALGVALDGRWSSASVVLEAEVLSITLILVAAWRDAADLHGDTAWLFVGGLAGLLVVFAGLRVLAQRAGTGSRAAASGMPPIRADAPAESPGATSG